MLTRVLETFITKDGHRIRGGTVYEWTGGGNLPGYLVPLKPQEPFEAPVQQKPGRRGKQTHEASE